MKTPKNLMPMTERQKRVLSLIASDHSNRAIAADLAVSEETVKTHVREILARLEMQSRAGAVGHALRKGLIQ